MIDRATQLRLFGIWCRANAIGGLDRPGELAFRAFATPPQPRITPKQQAYLAEARRSYLRYNDTRLALYEWGAPEAPYVYCAYGWGYNAGRWRHFAPQLVAAGYRVVGFDYPGHGNSQFSLVDYPTVLGVEEAVLRHFGRPELLLAHSFGAGTSTAMLAGLPDELRPSRAVVMAPFSDVRYLFEQYARALGFGPIAQASLERAVERHTGEHLDAFDPARASRTLGHVAALIVHDPADEVTAFSNGRRLHAQWPGSALLPAAEAGHGISDAAATRAVIEFLVEGRLPAGAAASPSVGAAADHDLERFFSPLARAAGHQPHRSRYYRG